MSTKVYRFDQGTLHLGDALATLREMPAESVHTCVTSPPYWGLRDYGADGQMGMEPTPEEYINRMVAVFSEVRRVLKRDGTLWLNMGDGYATGGRGGGGSFMNERRDAAWKGQSAAKGWRSAPAGLKRKDLVGMPWRLALALQDDGWYLRQDIIWAKSNPMPESVRDRCTRSHEYIFLLSKSPRYYFDAAAIREPCVGFNQLPVAGSLGSAGPSQSRRRVHVPSGWDTEKRSHGSFHSDGRRKGNSKTFRGGGAYTEGKSFDNDTPVQRQSTGNAPNLTGLRNKRSVWTVATAGCKDAHFATFPPRLIEPCILAGTPIGGVVLDPFMGSGTTARVSQSLGRRWVGIELNPSYCDLIMKAVR